jgi:hypothetical protein
MAKKKVKAKNVAHEKGKESVETEVLVSAPDPEAQPAPPPAIEKEQVFKVMDNGQATFYTETEYRKKYGKKKSKK